MANKGYQRKLQNLIRFLKDDRKCRVKQGEVFILTLLDKVVAFLVPLYHLEKPGDHNDTEARVFMQLSVSSKTIPPGHDSKGAKTLSPGQPLCTKTLPQDKIRNSKAPSTGHKDRKF